MRYSTHEKKMLITQFVENENISTAVEEYLSKRTHGISREILKNSPLLGNVHGLLKNFGRLATCRVTWRTNTHLSDSILIGQHLTRSPRSMVGYRALFRGTCSEVSLNTSFNDTKLRTPKLHKAGCPKQSNHTLSSSSFTLSSSGEER